MDESNLRLDRLIGETAGLMKLLAGYPRAFADPTETNAIGEQFSIAQTVWSKPLRSLAAATKARCLSEPSAG